MTTFNDPNISNQWHLGMINAFDAWTGYSGRGVTVGIFDTGVDYRHEDLAANFDRSLDVRSGGKTWDPFPEESLESNEHGTAAAGIVGAIAGNGRGGAGVAHGATLGAVDIFGDVFQSGLDNDDALGHMAAFDVASNSWGFPVAFEDYQDSGQRGTQLFDLARTYEHSVEAGRGGLGTVIVQAAGNEDSNAQGSGENTIRTAITVGAISRDGFVASYSNYGTNLLVSAPAATFTTDITGTAGDDPGNYTSSFGGTSAATPVVAGVVALMLQANSSLGWRDVQTILAMSAQQTGSTYGRGAEDDEHGAWSSNGSDDWNGGGASFHASYGYGMVDALAAVRMAEAWSLLFADARTSANEITRTARDGRDQTIRDNATVTASVTVAASQAVVIEYVNVTVQLSHASVGDLDVVLVAPDGSEFMLFDRVDGGAVDNYSWTFGVAALQGVVSTGEWSVRVADTATRHTGILKDVSVEFHGAAQSRNDVQHFTDDFLELARAEGGRRVIADTDGGRDALNLSAVTGDVELNLDGAIRVDGRQWAALGADQFEYAVAGDGDDRLTGNAAANRLYGMRGDDSIFGGDGDDDLQGGAGDDRLEGGDGDDRLRGGSGRDELSGGDGDDVLLGGEDKRDLRDIIYGGAGDDFIDGGYGNDLLYGQGGNDTILGGFGADQLIGQDGDDVITGGAFSDRIFGNDGADFINGGFGSDRVTGGDGGDLFYHLGERNHGSDWIQDYDADEDDVLLLGNAGARIADFQVNYAATEGAGDGAVREAFVIYRPTGQIVWALVDGGAQDSINLQIGSQVYDIA